MDKIDTLIEKVAKLEATMITLATKEDMRDLIEKHVEKNHGAKLSATQVKLIVGAVVTLLGTLSAAVGTYLAN